jgi:hypothetical protein
MIVQDVIRKAQRRFGDSHQVLVENADFYDWINEAQIEIHRENGDILTVTGVAASAFPWALPATFIRMYRVTYGGRPLDEVNILDLDNLDIDLDEFGNYGPPNFYYFNNEQLHLFPDPVASDSTSVSVEHFAVPATVSALLDNLTVPVVYHEDVVTFVVARCHERNENWDAYARFKDEFDRKISNRTEDKRKSDSYPVIRDDPWDYQYDLR